MTYFSKQFLTPVTLPDGSVATNASEIEAFLNKTGLTSSSDYSKEYLKNCRFLREQTFKKELFETFLTNYKRMIFK